MRIVVDVGHPAHVHFFRNAIHEWKRHGHAVFITARAKRLIRKLLGHYKLDYEMVSGAGTSGWLSLSATMISHTLRTARLIRSFRADVITSISSPMAALAAQMSGIPHISFDDTEHAGLEHVLYLPFTKTVYTPLRFGKDFGTKQKRYPGYHELAYLHPRRFVPDPNVLKDLGFQETDSFFVVRLVAWKASHDLGQHGFQPGEANELIALLQEKGKVIVSSEATGKTELAGEQLEIHPAKMHDLLYYATLYVGEGGTMATEAAILGTPSIFVSSLTASNWTELEQDYGLMYSHTDGSSALKRIRDLLATKGLRPAWQLKRERLLKEKIDVTTFLVEAIETEGSKA